MYPGRLRSVHAVDAAEFAPLFWDFEPPADWAAFCQERGLLAFVAREEDQLAGYAVATSNPVLVHILTLEGDGDACRCLLARLVRLAGERDMSGLAPLGRTEVQALLRRLGFTRLSRVIFRGQPSYFYHWSRNEGSP
jgi:hypothetical protein